MNLYPDYKIISLGYNCCPKKFTNYINISQPTNLFDYIATPMWGINELLENDYTGLTDINNYKIIPIMKNDNEILTNLKYYFRFLHDFKNQEITNSDDEDNVLEFFDKMILVRMQFNEFKNKYERRIVRFKELLKNEEKILFIRYEEPIKNRIIYDEYKIRYQKEELEYIRDFALIIKKQYPDLEFKIIYISYKHDTKKEDNITILKMEETLDTADDSGPKFTNLFNKYKDFLL
jgi:hypothetical protein